jgi:hypothetical protein
VFLAHHPLLVEQGGSPLNGGQLGFELGDALAGSAQLGVVARRRAGKLTPIDPLLADPPIDRLSATPTVAATSTTRRPDRTWSTTIARNCCAYESGTVFLLEVVRQSHNLSPTRGGHIRWTTQWGPLTAATAAAAGAADLSPTGRELYRQRNVVEGPLALPKQWRGLATRYDKHAQIYGGPVVLAAVLSRART